jgi:hypothetical protein
MAGEFQFESSPENQVAVKMRTSLAQVFEQLVRNSCRVSEFVAMTYYVVVVNNELILTSDSVALHVFELEVST